MASYLANQGFEVALLEPGAVGVKNAIHRGVKNVIHGDLVSVGFKDASMHAHFADREQSFRSIVITRFGDRDRAERRWTLISFAFSGPFVETLL